MLWFLNLKVFSDTNIIIVINITYNLYSTKFKSMDHVIFEISFK